MRKMGWQWDCCCRNRKKFWKSRCCCTVMSVIIGLLAAILCISGFSGLITQVDAPEGLVSGMSCMALCAGSFTAGYIAARKRRRHGLWLGIGCGLLMYCLVFFFGLLMMNSFSGAGFFFRLFLMLLCGAIGGICGVNTQFRRPPR